jgi:lysophospholipid hydrolase
MPVPDYHNFQYGTLQFGKFEEIQKQGYHAAIDILEKFDDEGRLPSASIDSNDGLAKGRKKGRSARRNSI